MDVILASQPRRVISKSLSFANYNKTASEDFHWLFRLELHTSITVSGGSIGDVRGLHIGNWAEIELLGAVSWSGHIEFDGETHRLAGLPRVGMSRDRERVFPCRPPRGRGDPVLQKRQ